MKGRPIFTSARSGNGRDDWETPRELFGLLDARFHFELDVCASPGAAKCRRFFTPEQDGLSRPWAPDVCWLNPPYSSAGPWLEKAVSEASRGAVVVALVPPRTDTEWWQGWAMRAERVVLLGGRVQFLLDGQRPVGQDGKLGSNNTPSALLVFDPHGRFRKVRLGVEGPALYGWDWRTEPQLELFDGQGIRAGQAVRCSVCNVLLPSSRGDARTCSARCRKAKSRMSHMSGQAGVKCDSPEMPQNVP